MSTPVTEQQARARGEWPNILYRSWPNKRDYSFTFAFDKGCWRIYINNSPDYQGRDSGSVKTHRLGLATRPYICWDRPIRSLSEAQGVAALWADSTENYIAKGSFQPPVGRPDVADRSVLNGFASASNRQARGTTTAPGSSSRARSKAQPSLWQLIKDQFLDN